LIPCLKSAVKRKLGNDSGLPYNVPAPSAGTCRKNLCIWESEYIQGPQERLAGSHNPVRTISLQSIKSYFSPYGCQRADSFLSGCGNKRA
jgi:hypothetical protein